MRGRHVSGAGGRLARVLGGSMGGLRLRHVVSDERGQAMVEYAMLILLIALACVGALRLIPGPLTHIFSTVTDAFP